MVDAETRYDAHDKELLAIVESFKRWRHYLEGSCRPVKVLSDHANLKPFMTTKELNGRQARWAERLVAFDFTLEFRPGSKNPGDAPSRRPDYFRGEPEQTALPTLYEKLKRSLQSPLSPETMAEGELRPATEYIRGDGRNEDRSSPTRGKTLTLAHGHQISPRRSTAPHQMVDLVEPCRGQKTPVDGSQSGLWEGPELLMPRSVVVAAMQDETAYTDAPSTMLELLARAQQEGAQDDQLRLGGDQ